MIQLLADPANAERIEALPTGQIIFHVRGSDIQLEMQPAKIRLAQTTITVSDT